MPAKIRVKIGSSTAKFNNGAAALQNYFIQKVGQEITKTISDKVGLELLSVKRRLETGVRNELTNAFKFIASKLIGLPSPTVGSLNLNFFKLGGDTGFGPMPRGGKAIQLSPRSPAIPSVNWRHLSHHTTTVKTANKEAFFLETGALRDFFRDNARQLAERTGVLSVTVRNEQGRFIPFKNVAVPVGSLFIRVVPNLKLPGIESGSLASFDNNMSVEKALGIGGKYLEKLENKHPFGTDNSNQVIHRPLVQPVLTYWTMFRLPRKIGSIINKEIFKIE